LQNRKISCKLKISLEKEANRMSYEIKCFDCGNFFDPPSCDPWIIKNMSGQADESKQELNREEIIANEICAKCGHFTPKEK